MQFECNGRRRSPGVFATFRHFKDFRAWACREFGLGPSLTAFVAYYDTTRGQWVPLAKESLSVTEFAFAPYYTISQAWPTVVVSVVKLLRNEEGGRGGGNGDACAIS
jgi:hypothetical protein